MKRYKNIIIIGIIGVLFTLVVIWFFSTSQHYFQKDITIDISSVIYNHSENESQEITDQFDLEELESLLKSIQCKRYKTSFVPYWQGDVLYEINGVYNHEPCHILVGTSDINYIYVSSDGGGYKIVNSNSLIENIAKLVQSH